MLGSLGSFIGKEVFFLDAWERVPLLFRLVEPVVVCEDEVLDLPVRLLGLLTNSHS